MKPQRQTIYGPILTGVKEGQPYVDEPVYEQAPVYCGKEPMVGQVVRYYTRVPLRWMEPNGAGGLKPRFPH